MTYRITLEAVRRSVRVAHGLPARGFENPTQVQPRARYRTARAYKTTVR